jgi:hypothetical protein
MTKDDVYWIIIGVLVVIIILLKSCNTKPETKYITKIDTIPGDSVPYEVRIPKPYAVYRDTGRAHLLFQKVDTQDIINSYIDYYAKYVYQDTLKNDTSALVVVKDTTFMNKLQGRSLIFQNRRVKYINTNVQPVLVPGFRGFIGLQLTGNLTSISAAPTLVFLTKSENMYSLGFDPFQKVGMIGLYWKLSFRRSQPP